jgi:3-dehydroquinate synthase
MKSKVEFLKKWPTESKLTEAVGFKPEKFLILYDRRLSKNAEFAKWIKDFKFAMPLSGGEELKDFSKFSDLVKKVVKFVSPFSASNLCIVGVGGGTIGDFTGFLASLLKRGLPLIHIPTTLLAAMDSAHGGKTALNLGQFKNQIGTFYPADAILIVQSIFEGLPEEQIKSGVGELAKMAFIDGGELYQAFKDKFEMSLSFVWEQLPKAIEAKYGWVEKDPLERTGERQVLNLGHSLGHVIESYYSIPHGIAVGHGLAFVVRWSQHQGYLPVAQETEALQLLEEKIGFSTPKAFAKAKGAFSKSRLFKLLSEDKKLVDERHLTCVFLKAIGQPLRKKMTLESFVTETQRQGWTSL